MPVRFHYHPEQKLLLGRGWGRLTAADLLGNLLPDYPVGTPELFDLREVEEADLAGADIRRVAERERRGPNRISKMAILTASTVSYGLSRMFQLLADDADYEIHVFTELVEALKWIERELPPGMDDT